MKTLLSLSVILLITNIACTAYESDAHKLIKEQGKYEDNKVVISSTDSFEESFCMLNNPDYKEFLDTNSFLVNGSLPELSIKFNAYNNLNNSKVKIDFTSDNLTYTCLFNLKQPDFSTENIISLSEYGIDSLQDALD